METNNLNGHAHISAESPGPMLAHFGQTHWDTLRKLAPDILTMKIPPIAYLIEKIIPRGQVGMITGEAGSGKSTVTSSMLNAIAQGIPWCGYNTIKTPVFVFDKENGITTTYRRLKRLGCRDASNVYWFGGWTVPPVDEIDEVLKLTSPCEPKPLIVIDSFAAYLDGDENKSQDTRRLFNSIRPLVNSGATLLFIHHTGKGESTKQYRGSSDIKGSVDYGYTLNSKVVKGKIQAASLKCWKVRDEIEHEIKFAYVKGEDGSPDRFEIVGDTNSSASPTIRPEYAALVKLLQQQNGPISKNALEKLAKGEGISQKICREFVSECSVGPNSTVEKTGEGQTHFVSLRCPD